MQRMARAWAPCNDKVRTQGQANGKGARPWHKDKGTRPGTRRQHKAKGTRPKDKGQNTRAHGPNARAKGTRTQGPRKGQGKVCKG